MVRISFKNNEILLQGEKEDKRNQEVCNQVNSVNLLQSPSELI